MGKNFYEPVYDITADAGVKVWGQSLEELICNSIRALMNEMLTLPSEDSIKQTSDGLKEIVLEVESVGFPYLLADILNKVLYLFDVKKFVPLRCEVLELKPTGEYVKLRLLGETYDPQKHGKKLLIKAATYHRLYLEEKDGKYEAQIIFDI
jgi:SHS2 domain-containing protein